MNTEYSNSSKGDYDAESDNHKTAASDQTLSLPSKLLQKNDSKRGQKCETQQTGWKIVAALRRQRGRIQTSVKMR